MEPEEREAVDLAVALHKATRFSLASDSGAVSSAEERFVDIEEVRGSTPLSPTMEDLGLSVWMAYLDIKGRVEDLEERVEALTKERDELLKMKRRSPWTERIN